MPTADQLIRLNEIVPAFRANCSTVSPIAARTIAAMC